MRLCDLDLNDEHIRVRKSLKNDDGVYLGELKTDSSYRAVKLTRETTFVLEEFLEYRTQAKERADDWGGVDTVFCTQKGNLTWPSTPRRKLNRVLETTDLPHITMHEFRHTHATMLIRSGVSIYNVSRRLGHSSVKTTERRYLDYVPSMQQETVDTYQTSMDF